FLRVKDIQNGRVIYRRRKTGKIYNIGLTEKASKLIAHFTDLKTADPEAFVLPIIPPGLKDLEAKIKQSRETYRHCNKALKRIARLCQIDKPISTYYARYSWANIARVYFGTNS
ncbi:MAG: hypothetical protein KDC41_02865, partial [Saprospiraceae bacterium]|nr:hypothetical protein [Saprospiraceae bacterium]